jgi:hypothetical protein
MVSALEPANTASARMQRYFSAWQRSPRSLRIGSVILAIHVILAGLGPFIAPYGYAIWAPEFRCPA